MLTIIVIFGIIIFVETKLAGTIRAAAIERVRTIQPHHHLVSQPILVQYPPHQVTGKRGSYGN